jgi:hypothetical protein
MRRGDLAASPPLAVARKEGRPQKSRLRKRQWSMLVNGAEVSAGNNHLFVSRISSVRLRSTPQR